MVGLGNGGGLHYIIIKEKRAPELSITLCRIHVGPIN